MKRTIALLLVSTLLLGVVGCSRGGNDNAAESISGNNTENIAESAGSTVAEEAESVEYEAEDIVEAFYEATKAYVRDHYDNSDGEMPASVTVDDLVAEKYFSESYAEKLKALGPQEVSLGEYANVNFVKAGEYVYPSGADSVQ